MELVEIHHLSNCYAVKFLMDEKEKIEVTACQCCVRIKILKKIQWYIIFFFINKTWKR
jgi:hypothetical protein